MKKKIGIIMIVILLSFAIFAIVVSAQDRGKKSDKEIQNFISPGMAGMMGRGLRGMGRPGGPMGMRYPGGMMGLGRPDMIMGMADKLGLSADQRNELNDIFTSHRKDMIRKNADLEIAKVELQKLLSQDEPAMNAIKEKIHEIANLEAEMKFSQIKVWMDAKNTLTQDQRKSLKELMKKGPDLPMGRMRRGILDDKSE